MTSGRPEPVPTPLTAGFWDAARKGRLVVRECVACGRLFHPPPPQCFACGASDLRWREVSGRGAVSEFTVMHSPRVRGFDVPYTCVLVELDEQPELMVVGNLPGDAARVGLRVRVTFVDTGDGYVLPQFEVA